jgi:phytoene/squalene synthetase
MTTVDQLDRSISERSGSDAAVVRPDDEDDAIA